MGRRPIHRPPSHHNGRHHNNSETHDLMRQKGWQAPDIVLESASATVPSGE